MLTGNGITHAKSQSSARANLMPGENWVKNLINMRRVDPGAIITKMQRDVDAVLT